MTELTAAYVAEHLPRRDPEGHKGDFGKVLCLCGSVGYTGAAVFASRAAVRTGSGLVFLGVPEPIWPVAAVKSDEAMPFPLPAADGRLSLAAEGEIRRRLAQSVRRRPHRLRPGPGTGDGRADPLPAGRGNTPGAGRRWHKCPGGAYRCVRQA